MKKLISLSILLCSLAAMGQENHNSSRSNKTYPKSQGSIPVQSAVSVTIKLVSGSLTQTKVTGKDGVVKFENLAAGDYSITYEQLSKTENINSSLNNGRPSITRDGKTVIFFTITPVKDTGPKKVYTPILFNIGSNGGMVEVAVKE